MMQEARLFKLAIRQYLAAEVGGVPDVKQVWELRRALYQWQEHHDPHEQLFPMPRGAKHDFEGFEQELWPKLSDDLASYGDNLERGYNICLMAIATRQDERVEATQILFSIHPNIILEKFSLDDGIPAEFYFEADEVEILHDLMVSRLDSPDKRLMSLNLIKKASEELSATGLDSIPMFKELEQKIQDTIVVETSPEDMIIRVDENRPAPELTLVPGGKDDE